MTLTTVLQWIEDTAWSTALRESIWAYPVVESSHVITLFVFLGLTMAMDARLLGFALTRVPVGDVMRRTLPWIRGAFAVMVVSGVLLFATTPVRFSENVFFLLKFAFLFLAGVNVWVFHRRLYPTVDTWGRGDRLPRGARIAGAVSLTMWIVIVATGRLIAYNWFE